MNWATLVANVLSSLVPLALQIAQRALAGEPDPYAAVLGEHAAQTIPAPLRSRVALDAAEALDEARRRGSTP